MKHFRHIVPSRIVDHLNEIPMDCWTTLLCAIDGMMMVRAAYLYREFWVGRDWETYFLVGGYNKRIHPGVGLKARGGEILR